MDEQNIRNMQINYYIMRKLWVKHKGKSPDGHTIFNAFDMSRTRYDRIIDGVTIRQSHDEIINLNRTTGLKVGYFKGDIRLDFPKISNEKWEEYFKLRQMTQDDKKDGVTNKYNEEDYKRVKAKIDTTINKYVPSENDGADEAVKNFIAYLKDGTPKFHDADKQLDSTLKILKANSLHVMESATLENLRVYGARLYDHYQLVLGLWTVRKAKESNSDSDSDMETSKE